MFVSTTSMRLRRLAAVSLVSVLAAGGCSAGSGKAPTPAAQAPMATVAVTAGGAAGERQFDGVVEALQQATLYAQTSGRIAAVVRDVDEPVRAGQPILTLTDVEQRAAMDQAEQSLREAEARAIQARADYARAVSIYERKLVAKSALDAATAERDAAEARLKAATAGVAAARQQFGYTQIVAPYDGVVTQRLVEPGEAVSPGQPLAGVAALGALRVVVDLPQSEAVRVRALGRATAYVGDQAVQSRRVTVYPAASSESNTVRVRVDLPTGLAGLYPGMFAKVGFALGGGTNLSVPAASVVRRSEVTAVYTVGSDGTIAFRQVRLGRPTGDRIEVLAGLHEGDRIAADPLEAARRLKAR